mmetsp:Transcript_29416/g.51570  ORF Transcript_29416/g.51570 Transcript_29416/m.51570 type:complete len:190 (-) Transcript_29416:291-860(-)
MDAPVLRLSVQLLSGAEERFEVDQDTTLKAFKLLLQERLGHRPCAQRLFFDGTPLTRAASTFSELEVPDGSILTLVVIQSIGGKALSDKDLVVGTTVKLSADESHVKQAFRPFNGTWRWDNGMRRILGTDQVVAVAARNGIFGLPEAVKRSGFPVWYYPLAVVEEAWPPEEATEEEKGEWGMPGGCIVT